MVDRVMWVFKETVVSRGRLSMDVTPRFTHIYSYRRKSYKLRKLIPDLLERIQLTNYGLALRILRSYFQSGTKAN